MGRYSWLFIPLLLLHLIYINKSQIQSFEKKILIKPLQDSNTVIKLNKEGYESRLNDPHQSLLLAEQALKMAKSISYTNGEAEAYRIRGIAKYYLSQTEAAVADYLLALELFKNKHNRLGEAKVLNNIGNLYLGADYDKALEYFTSSLKIAEQLNEPDLMANIFLNIGNIFVRKKKYSQALGFYGKGEKLYQKTGNKIGLTHCLQNKGKIYYELNQLKLAKQVLIKALISAKSNGLNVAGASILLTLSSVYIAQKEFKKAEISLKEGMKIAELVNDTKLIYDYQYTNYELELQRKNYKSALNYLQILYKQDSLNHADSESSRISLLQEQFKQRELKRENELITLRQKQNRIILISTLIVTFMSIIVIVVLAMNVRRKIKTNLRLQVLNQEIMKQKDDLNRINLHLEELIDERTKDLRIKNKKLSEYSAHLSHEIRGPVASIKGLMILESENMIEHHDLIAKLSICIELMDEKIHRLNESLNDPDMPDLSGHQPA